MSQRLELELKGLGSQSKEFRNEVHTASGDKQSYLANLADTITSLQKDCNEYLTQVIEKKQAIAGASEHSYEDNEDMELSGDDEGENGTEAAEHQAKKIKSA